MAKKDLVPSNTFDWLERPTDEYLPFTVELDPELKGWAQYCTLMCDKKWRIRSKDTLVFESRDDAERIYEKWGVNFAYYAETGRKIQQRKTLTITRERKAEIFDGISNAQVALTGIKEINNKDKWKLWERQSIAYQMHCCQYSHNEIAEELNFADNTSIQRILNYVRKQKFHENIDYARIYRDENLSYLTEAKLALVDHMRKTGFEKNSNLMTIFLQIVKEENLISGAYSPEKMQVLSAVNIEHMNNQELLKYMNQIIAENEVIEADSDNSEINKREGENK